MPDGASEKFSAGLNNPNQLEIAWEIAFLAQRKTSTSSNGCVKAKAQLTDEGGRRAAAIDTLIATAKLNDVDPEAWPANVLARLQDHPARRIAELLPWN